MLKEAMMHHLVIARVTVRVREPCLGFRADRLLFPTGEFTLALTSPELEWVFQHGEVVQCYELAEYEGGEIFSDYVEWFYRDRQLQKSLGNKVRDYVDKILLNSLYGKFGQRGTDTTLLGDCPAELCEVEDCVDADTHTRFQLRRFGGREWRTERVERESYNSFPAVASFVTAYARMRLWGLLEKAGRDHVWYCDTDSLYCDEAALMAVGDEVDPSELGQLKIEHFYDWVHFHGCKDYETPWNVKIKGVRKDAVKKAEGVYEQTRFAKFLSSLRLGSISKVLELRAVKRLRRVYEKGLVGADGRVSPYQLGKPLPTAV